MMIRNGGNVWKFILGFVATVATRTMTFTVAMTEEEMICDDYGTCRVASLSNFATANNHLKCTVYMAPSTLGVDTSLGIYAGITLELGTVVNLPEIAIPFPPPPLNSIWTVASSVFEQQQCIYYV